MNWKGILIGVLTTLIALAIWQLVAENLVSKIAGYEGYFDFDYDHYDKVENLVSKIAGYEGYFDFDYDHYDKVEDAKYFNTFNG